MNSERTDAATAATHDPRAMLEPREPRAPKRARREFPIPPELPHAALLRVEQVLLYIPVCRAAWFKGVKEGIYPKPKRFGKHSLWHTRDIAALMMNGPRQLRGAKARAAAH